MVLCTGGLAALLRAAMLLGVACGGPTGVAVFDRAMLLGTTEALLLLALLLLAPTAAGSTLAGPGGASLLRAPAPLALLLTDSSAGCGSGLRGGGGRGGAGFKPDGGGALAGALGGALAGGPRALGAAFGPLPPTPGNCPPLARASANCAKTCWWVMLF